MNNEEIEMYENHSITTKSMNNETYPFSAILFQGNGKPWLEIRMTTKQACRKMITRYNNSVSDESFKAGLRAKDYLVGEL